MAGSTPIYEQFRSQNSIRSIQPVQSSPPRDHYQQTPSSQEQYQEQYRPSSRAEEYPYTNSQLQRSPQRSPVRRARPQSQLVLQEVQPARELPSHLKHTRSQSHALFSLKRKEVDNNATPKRAQSVLQPQQQHQHQHQQHIRVSHGSDISEHSGVSSGNESQVTAETSTSHYQPTQKYSHHAAVKGAVGYVPEDPVMQPAAFSKKIVVVGDGGSGKTSLLMRYKERVFPKDYVPTVFENYITLKHHRGTGKTVEVALWDTAGQEEYDRLRPLSYPETSVVLICFAIDCPQSLDSVKEKWYPEVAHFCPETPIVLIANKADLRDNYEAIDKLEGQGLKPCSTEEGHAMAKFIGADAYFECSSMNFINVDQAFEAAIDVSVARERGTDWSQGPLAQDMKKGRMGEASQILSKPMSSGRTGASRGGDAERTKEGIRKKKKSRACKIL